jgi:UDP-N-acetylglucosamine acyltransferase
MAYCHVAHNCKLGNYVIMANAAHLAGHIEIEDFAIIGGLTGIHQFTRIGCHAIIGGASAVPKDVPPYVTAAGNHAKLYGLNLIGLRRRGFKEETIESLKKAYRIVFRSRLLLSKAIERVENEIDNVPEVRHFIEFMKKSQRGVCR